MTKYYATRARANILHLLLKFAVLLMELVMSTIAKDTLEKPR